jgi:hypothetical protein
MREVNVALPIDVAVDTAWAVLSDFPGFLDWASGGKGEIRIEGHGVGMIRHLKLPIGEIGERLLELDDENRTLGYALAYGEPLGMKEYQALVQVKESEDGSVAILWHGMFEARPGQDEDELAKLLAASYESMTTALVAYIRARKS